MGRAGSDSSKAAEPWEGAPVPSEVHRGWDVSEAGRGFGPTGNLGKLCLPKGEWGQPPKSVKQRCPRYFILFVAVVNGIVSLISLSYFHCQCIGMQGISVC